MVKIVREKYLNQVPMEDDVKYQQFLSELYVFLVDQMHIGLRKVWSIKLLPLLSHAPPLSFLSVFFAT